MSKLPIALQLYTVRDQCERDFAGTLRHVARIGYTAVELAGTYGLGARDLAGLLQDNGLQVVGSHTGLDQLEDNLQDVLDFNQTIGNKHVVCPWLGEDRRKSGDDWKRTAALFNTIGQACRERGITFCYHNHAFEFEQFDGRAGLDILFDEADPTLVHSELDTYWVAYGGQDPAEYARKLAGRVPLVHLKDMTEVEGQRTFAEVGEGIMDWPRIIAACQEAGALHYIVEQDTCRRPSLESVEISLNNLRRMGYA